MLFVQRAPAPPLDRAIALLWCCVSEPRPFALERVLPTGSGQLIVNLKEDETRMYQQGAMTTSAGAVVSGAWSRYVLIDTAEQECAAGVSFLPGGMAAFFPAPAHELRDCGTPLESLWGRTRTEDLRDGLLSARTATGRLDVLERTMQEAFRPARLDPAMRFALDAFGAQAGLARIGAVAGDVGLSSKRFIERFRPQVGLAPKQYCRILRFQRALAQAEGGRAVEWTRIAADCGYFDQSHFIHDFRAFSGITPTGYETGRTQFRNHVNFLQAEAGAPVR